MIKVPICVLNDPKECIGTGFICKETGDYIATGYVVNQDSIYGDGVFNALMENYEEDHINAIYGEDQHVRFSMINRKLAYEDLSEISTNPEDAERLRNFCIQQFTDFTDDLLEFEIIYFNSLQDAEQNNLEKTLVL